MQQPQPQSRSFDSILHGIEHGTIKIPQFQRDFVWPKEKSARLMDSILKGYPIGTFIIWKTREQLRSVRNIGDQQLPPTPDGDYVEQELDGQQRLTSLFAAVRGLDIEREGKKEQFKSICVDLDANAEKDEPVVLPTAPKENPLQYVPVVEVLEADFDLLSRLTPERRNRLQAYKDRVNSYQFSIILITDAPIDVATEIFTRINVSGQPLSVFEIMVAKTYDHASRFDLAERFAQASSCLADVGYGSIPPIAFLQTASLLMVGECQKQDILRLSTADFRANWPNVEDAIERACDYFRSFFRIPVSKLLPYASLVVPFAYFFAKHPDKPEGAEKNQLRELFWRTSLSGRYTSASETKLAQDARRVDSILRGQEPEYDYGVDISPKAIEDYGRFNTGRSFVKALLCVLAYQRPRSFIDDSLVTISNDWLKRANSKNYHHFFPKAYLRNLDCYEPWEINHIANITIVDDFLNKRKIKTRAPSDYMKEFKHKNPEITDTMNSHLIDLDSFGVWDDDYDTFFAQRCRLFSKYLRKWVPLREIDKAAHRAAEDDLDPYEEEEELALSADD